MAAASSPATSKPAVATVLAGQLLAALAKPAKWTAYYG